MSIDDIKFELDQEESGIIGYTYITKNNRIRVAMTAISDGGPAGLWEVRFETKNQEKNTWNIVEVAGKLTLKQVINSYFKD